MATNGGPDIVTDGLVLYLDASNKKSYPASGTTWIDITGNGNNGFLINGPTFDNRNIIFDGIDDRIDLPYIDIPQSSDITIEILFKHSDSQIRTPTSTQIQGFLNPSLGGRRDGYYRRLISVNNTTPEISIFTAAYPTNGKYDAYIRILGSGLNNYPTIFSDTYNTNGDIVSQQTINDFLLPNVFFHYVWVISNNPTNRFIRHYINSKRFTSLIGGQPTENFSFFQQNNLRLSGKNNISFLKIYNKVLSDNEILFNFNATKGRFNL